MFDSGSTAYRSAVAGVLFTLGVVATNGIALAQELPRSFVASPDVYKILAQNDQYLVIEVTWKPGQRDQFHSHPATAVYYVNDCNLRGHFPSGKTGENARKAGTARVQAPIASHFVENIGKSECKLIMFEPK
jgi:hypothetical protein